MRKFLVTTIEPLNHKPQYFDDKTAPIGGHLYPTVTALIKALNGGGRMPTPKIYTVFSDTFEHFSKSAELKPNCIYEVVYDERYRAWAYVSSKAGSATTTVQWHPTLQELKDAHHFD